MKKKLFAGLLAAALTLSLAACGKAPDAGSALTIAMGKDENTLAPFTYVSSTGLTVNRLVYDTLFTTDPENNIIPWMVADDYTVSEDSRVYTMKLLPGQKFHDGSPLTAADVAFTFTYCKDQNAATFRRISNSVEQIEILAGETLRFTLKEPSINFLRDGLCAMRIISKAVYENQPDGTVVTASIGSGMYRLAEYKTGQYYKLEAVEDYFRGTPRVAALQMPIMEDASAVQQALLSGEVAAATTTIGVEVLDTFRSKAGIEVLASPGYSPVMLNINNGRAPLDSTDFRMALTHAIDVAGIMETLYSGYASVGTYGLVRSDLSYALPGLEYEYAPDKANALLDGLGYTAKNADGIRLGSDGKPLSLTVLVYANSTLRIRMAELMVPQLKAVGLDLAVKAMEMDTVDAYVWPDFEVSKGRDYDLAMWGWGSSLSPEYLIDLCASDFARGGDNVCGYRNTDFDALVEGELSKAASMEEMENLLDKLQTIVAQDPPLVNMGFPDNLQACNTALYDGWKTVKGGNVVNIFSFLP